MKLLYILDRLSQGGISTVLIHRLNYLAKQADFEIHILTEVANDINIQKQFVDEIAFYNINYAVLADKKRLPFFGYFSFQRQLKKTFSKIIDKINPDIISTFNVEALNNFIIPHIETRAIKIIEFHGAYESKSWLISRKLLVPESKLKKLRLLLFHPVNLFVGKSKKLHRKYDYGIVLTKEDEEDRRKYLSIKLKHIYNFMLNEKEITPFEKRKNIILGVGRMVEQKNLLDIVEAVNLIKSSLNNWKVKLYGEGEQYRIISERIAKYDLQNIILLEGYNYHMHEVYNESKLLVTPALWEGQPMNILEAFSYRIPVISYNCKCGPKEIIRDGVNGYLVDFDIRDLASKILKLISDENLLRSFSDSTSLDIHKFAFDKVMNNWKSFYEDVTNKNL